MENDDQLEAAVYRVRCDECKAMLEVEIVEDELNMNYTPQYCPMCREAVNHNA